MYKTWDPGFDILLSGNFPVMYSVTVVWGKNQ